MRNKNFAGKQVYVIGGSSGIGLATGEQLARAGAHVSLFALPDGLPQAAAKVNQCAADGAHVRSFALDVTSRAQTEQVLARAMANAGAPAAMIHCVGRARPRPFDEVSYEQFDETMKINVYGTWHVLSAIVPAMRKAGGGRIAIISSLAGLIGVYGYADYCASKYALIGLGEVLRMELASDGVTVSVLCPPDTDTPGFHAENRTKPKETAAISGTTRVMQPAQVATALLDGMSAGRFLIVPRLENRLAYAAKRLLPRLAERYMLARIAASRRAERG